MNKRLLSEIWLKLQQWIILVIGPFIKSKWFSHAKSLVIKNSIGNPLAY